MFDSNPPSLQQRQLTRRCRLSLILPALPVRRQRLLQPGQVSLESLLAVGPSGSRQLSAIQRAAQRSRPAPVGAAAQLLSTAAGGRLLRQAAPTCCWRRICRDTCCCLSCWLCCASRPLGLARPPGRNYTTLCCC